MEELYPWPGTFSTGNEASAIAVVTLDEELDFEEKKEDVAVWGPMKTENLGIERVVANVISNPNIRYLIVCGEEIKGHKSGCSLVSLHENGIDEKGKIIEAPGAVPYIENISEEAVDRFRDQIEIIDRIGIKNKQKIVEAISNFSTKERKAFGDPFIAIEIDERETQIADTDLALHSSLRISIYGNIKKKDR